MAGDEGFAKGSPPNSIPQEHWRVIEAQARRLQALKPLFSRIESGDRRPLDVVSEELSDIQEIMNAMQNQCCTVLAIFNHDGGSPLALLRGDIDLVRYKYRDKLGRRQKIEKLLWVLESMKFFTESMTVQPNSVNIQDFFKEVWSEVEEAFHPRSREERQGYPVSLNIGETLVATIHKPTLAMLLVNMSKNVYHHGEATQLQMDAKKDGEKVILTVSDNGKGVAEENVDKIFEWGFSTGHSAHKGIGLGMARERLAAMGGSISCEPHGGLPNDQGSRGARFVIELRNS